MPLTNGTIGSAVRFGPEIGGGVGEAGESVVLPPLQLPPTVYAADPVQQHVVEVSASTINGVTSAHVSVRGALHAKCLPRHETLAAAFN
jgi:hypothetical protein